MQVAHNRKRLFWAMSVWVWLSLIVCGQTPESRMIDEFPMRYSGCDTGARLDNLALILQEEPTVTGYIIAYGPQGKGRGTSEDVMRVVQRYLTDMRGIDGSRLQFINGGRYKPEPTSLVELWTVPAGGRRPVPRIFSEGEMAFTGRFMSHEVYSPFDIEGLGGLGSVGLAVYADLLREQPETVGYIVARSKKGVPSENIHEALKLPALELEEVYGLNPERVKTIFGGYLKERFDAEDGGGLDTGTTAEYWILPANAPPPAKEAKIRTSLLRITALLGKFDDYLFESDALARLILDKWAVALQKQKGAKIYVVLRVVQPGPDKPNVAERPDLPKTIERLKADLQKKYGISQERLVVWQLPSHEDAWTSNIEVWLVPPGGALPDANPSAETDSEEPQ